MPITPFRFLSLLFVLLYLSACTKEDASNVNQDRIYTEYELFYDKNTDKTSAIARFKFGGITGTLLELDSTSFVKFNQDVLPYNALLGAHFKEYAGLISSGKFIYQNLDNQTFENSVPVFEPIAFPPLDTVHKAAAFTLSWVGTPLAANQEVGLLINGINQSDAQLFAQTAPGATALVLGVNQLNKLGIGTATAVLDRATRKDLTQGTSVGGFIVGKYRALNETFQVAN